MAQLDPTYDSLSTSYVFRQVNEKAAAYASSHPDADILKMGVGNTTLPLVPSVVSAMHAAVDRLASAETYTGYGDELGESSTRQAIADFYKSEYDVGISSEEIVLSDGAKSDTANLPSILKPGSVVAVQDPVYPVYVESNIVRGNSIVYMPSGPENDFAPQLPDSHVDMIYLCSPNNPTGVVMTHQQLSEIVAYARERQALIIFDAAYSAFVTDKSLPRSIFEIDGAEECAIEVNSFSKWAGFTGVRLAWTIIPRTVRVEGSAEGEVLARWRRRQLVFFNGPSNVSQAGGIAAMSEQGINECREVIDTYLQNAKLILDTLQDLGLKAYGGDNSPYIWLQAPDGMGSWELFDTLLDKTHVVTTPGIGFGDHGEGFIRLSAFAAQPTVIEAMKRFKAYFSSK